VEDTPFREQCEKSGVKKGVDRPSVLGYMLGVIMNLNLRLSLNALLNRRAAVEV
jgi:hypothetical protein